MNVPAPDPADDGRRAPDGAPHGTADDQRARAARRRRLDEVFGDVLPGVTGDERGPGSRSAPGSDDEWYRQNRPPHHG